MIGRRVAGLAAIVSEMAPELMEELAESRIPVVFYDVGSTRGNVTSIRVNYRRGIEKVVDYLYSLGHRRLGFIGHHAILGPINERIKALLRRAYGDFADAGGGRVLRHDDLVIDLERRRVQRGGRKINLTPTEFEILRHLATRPGRVFTRSELLE